MSDDPLFMTLTMAQIQENQGRWAEAAKIYRHLLQQDPRNTTLQAGLQRARLQLAESSPSAPENLVQLLDQWLELLSLHRQTRDLRRVRKNFQP